MTTKRKRTKKPGIPAGSPPRDEPPPSERPRTSRAVSRRFDPLFSRYAGDIPVSYLRALAQRESSMNPAEQTGPAWGLMQIVPVVLKSYNERNGTSHARAELLDPELNVRIATETLTQIIGAYAADHSELSPAWTSRRYVELVTAGWNAGWSRKAGVLRVVSWLKARELPVTVDAVHQYAERAGGVRFLAMDQRLRWWKSVATLYAFERSRDRDRAAVA